MTLTSRDFNIWAAKAPVNCPGAQRTAVKLWREVRSRLTSDEVRDVQTALDHALGGPIAHGRDEFDKVAAGIRARLFGDRKGKQTKPEAWKGL